MSYDDWFEVIWPSFILMAWMLLVGALLFG